MDSLQDDAARVEALAGLSRFRREFYKCLPLRADALFELTDAVLCATGPVTSLPELSLSGVHRRGRGAMYDALAQGHINVSRLRIALAGLRLPRGADGQLSIALDVTAGADKSSVLVTRHVGIRGGRRQVGRVGGRRGR